MKNIFQGFTIDWKKLKLMVNFTSNIGRYIKLYNYVYFVEPLLKIKIVVWK